MSKTFAISDHHFGHANILRFEGAHRNGGALACVEDHDDWLVLQHNKTVGKADVTYFLGDVCFNMDRLETHVAKMNGTKHLILGNHDRYDTVSMARYQQVFKTVSPMKYWKGWIMTHVPLHYQELKSSRKWAGNMHGHLHSQVVNFAEVPDEQYMNVCVEHSNGIPVEIFRREA